MLLQRLATGATGVKQARYRQGPTRALVRACAVYTQPLKGETMHGVYEFRRGFCTLVLSFVVGKDSLELFFPALWL